MEALNEALLEPTNGARRSDGAAPVRLEWAGVGVVAGRKRRVILSEAGGVAKAGRTLALLGPSGAGKTTKGRISTMRSWVSRARRTNGQDVDAGARTGATQRWGHHSRMRFAYVGRVIASGCYRWLTKPRVRLLTSSGHRMPTFSSWPSEPSHASAWFRPSCEHDSLAE